MAPNDIFQFSLLSAYNAGLKDGGPPTAFLKTQGDHGIGLFEDEENDLVLVDGTPYAVDKDGDADLAEKDDQLPFVMVTTFQPKEKAKATVGTTAKKLKELLEKSRNTPLAFKIKGKFKYLNTQQQTYWDVTGHIFGFCIPSWQKTMSGDGLQAMYLSEDKETGGRVVDFETGDGATLEYAKCPRFNLNFSQDDEFQELRL